jgi:hypothetical protein
MNLRNSLILMSTAAAVAAFTASPGFAQAPKNSPAGVNAGKSDPAAPTYPMKRQRDMSGPSTGGGGDNTGASGTTGAGTTGSSATGDTSSSGSAGTAGGAAGAAGGAAGGAGGAGGGSSQ